MLDQRLVKAMPLDLCLAYANTCDWRGQTPPHETLHSYSDLFDWCLEHELIETTHHRQLIEWAQSKPDLADQLFFHAISLRELIYSLFYLHSTAGAVAVSTELQRFNQILMNTPRRGPLAGRAEGFYLVIDSAQIRAEVLLAPVIWSMADLLSDVNVQRVHCCENAECRKLFLDQSKTGKRRWCSMQSCGNRAKARRHYQRMTQSKRDSADIA